MAYFFRTWELNSDYSKDLLYKKKFGQLEDIMKMARYNVKDEAKKVSLEFIVEKKTKRMEDIDHEIEMITRRMEKLRKKEDLLERELETNNVTQSNDRSRNTGSLKERGVVAEVVGSDVRMKQIIRDKNITHSLMDKIHELQKLNKREGEEDDKTQFQVVESGKYNLDSCIDFLVTRIIMNKEGSKENGKSENGKTNTHDVVSVPNRLPNTVEVQVKNFLSHETESKRKMAKFFHEASDFLDTLGIYVDPSPRDTNSKSKRTIRTEVDADDMYRLIDGIVSLTRQKMEIEKEYRYVVEESQNMNRNELVEGNRPFAIQFDLHRDDSGYEIGKDENLLNILFDWIVFGYFPLEGIKFEETKKLVVILAMNGDPMVCEFFKMAMNSPTDTSFYSQEFFYEILHLLYSASFYTKAAFDCRADFLEHKQHFIVTSAICYPRMFFNELAKLTSEKSEGREPFKLLFDDKLVQSMIKKAGKADKIMNLLDRFVDSQIVSLIELAQKMPKSRCIVIIRDRYKKGYKFFLANNQKDYSKYTIPSGKLLYAVIILVHKENTRSDPKYIMKEYEKINSASGFKMHDIRKMLMINMNTDELTERHSSSFGPKKQEIIESTRPILSESCVRSDAREFAYFFQVQDDYENELLFTDSMIEGTFLDYFAEDILNKMEDSEKKFYRFYKDIVYNHFLIRELCIHKNHGYIKEKIGLSYINFDDIGDL